jgi:hypothetical protein
MNESDKVMLEWVRFVATKFQRNVEGWTYSRDKGDLEHIRYKSDHTGYNALRKRIPDAFRFGFENAFYAPKNSLARQLGVEKGRTIWERIQTFYAYFRIRSRKDDNLPDGLVNGSIVTHWEEDGEYIVMMGPTVGVKVLDFLEAEPDNVHAQAILTEMRRVREMSWGKKEEQ